MKVAMKSVLFTLLFAVISPAAMLFTGSAAQHKEPVRHVVVFKYKQSATAEQIKQVTDAFRELKGKIPGIISFEHGINNSPEGKNQGYTHVYLLTFENIQARDAYLPHAEHKKFGELLGKVGILEDVFVVDYLAQR